MQYYSNVIEKKKKRKVISILKEHHQVLCLLELSLKEQERINRVINGTVRGYMEENAQVMPQGKAYQQYLESTEKTSRTTYRKYVQQNHLRSKLKGNFAFNYRDIT